VFVKVSLGSVRNANIKVSQLALNSFSCAKNDPPAARAIADHWLLRVVIPACWKALEVLWRLRPSGRGRGAIINDSIGGKGLVLEAAVQPQPR
jgi:hypothetical protein